MSALLMRLYWFLVVVAGLQIAASIFLAAHTLPLAYDALSQLETRHVLTANEKILTDISRGYLQACVYWVYVFFGYTVLFVVLAVRVRRVRRMLPPNPSLQADSPFGPAA